MTTDTTINNGITAHNILSPHYKQGAERGERSEPRKAPTKDAGTSNHKTTEQRKEVAEQRLIHKN